ncbi:MAG: AAA family ATPase [Syntrophales bacterium]
MTDFYERSFVSQLEHRLSDEHLRIQVVMGPRQVGKTTGIKQLLTRYPYASHYANADDLLTTDRTWLLEQWQKALSLGGQALLVIDEIQKVPNWSETVRSLWDKLPGAIRVVVLGSSSFSCRKDLRKALPGGLS